MNILNGSIQREVLYNFGKKLYSGIKTDIKIFE